MAKEYPEGFQNNLLGPILVLFLALIIYIVVIALFWHIFHPSEILPPGE